MVGAGLDLRKKIPLWVISSEDEISPGHYYLRVDNGTYKWRPPTDVFETEDAILIKIEIAGMVERDFSVLLEDRKIVIQGVRQDKEKKLAFHQMEIRNGEFRIEIDLICPIDTEGVEAEYKNGFLRIFLPKAEKYRINIDE